MATPWPGPKKSMNTNTICFGLALGAALLLYGLPGKVALAAAGTPAENAAAQSGAAPAPFGANLFQGNFAKAGAQAREISPGDTIVLRL